MLRLVKALGRFARLGCCACKVSRFIRAATGCCGLERLQVDCAAYKNTPWPIRARKTRKIHYQHATTTAALALLLLPRAAASEYSSAAVFIDTWYMRVSLRGT